MRKGITPVVAVVLLIAVSVAGSVTVYEVYNAAQSNAEKYQPELGLDSGALSIESCWGKPDDFSVSVRNQGSETINASKIPVNLNTTNLKLNQDYTVQNPLVDPRQTFRLNINPPQPIDEQTKIRLITQSEIVKYRCLNLE